MNKTTWIRGLVMAVTFSVAVPWAILAADLDSTATLSATSTAPTQVTAGSSTPFTINVFASGSLNTPSNSNGEVLASRGKVYVTTVYNMATNGTITPSTNTADRQLLQFAFVAGGSVNYSSATFCASIPYGCASNPFVVGATLNVAAGTAGGTIGTLVVQTTAWSASTALTQDSSPYQGFVIVQGTPDPCEENPNAEGCGGTGQTNVTVHITCTPPPTNVWYGSNQSVPCTAWATNDTTSEIVPDALELSDQSFSLSTSVASGDDDATADTDSHEVCPILAGNCETAGPYTFMIDLKNPSISGSASTAWTNQPVSVTFTCSDTGSGIASCGPDTTVSTEGADQSATGNATDNVGNTASATVTGINIDLTAPTISGAASPAANGNGWNNTDVTVTWTCGDALSGIASCSAAETLTTEAANQSATGNAADNAGNTASATVTNISIDKTAPSLAPTLTGPFILHGSYTATPNASDSLSGIDTSSCSPLDTSTVGSHTYTCTATDLAGNTTTGTFGPVNVTYRLSCYEQPVDGRITRLGTFKLGSTIPLKCALLDAFNVAQHPTTAPALFAGIAFVSNQTTGDFTSAADSGFSSANTNGFRWDASAGHYIFNWSTKSPVTAGTWRVRATFENGQYTSGEYASADITLKK